MKKTVAFLLLLSLLCASLPAFAEELICPVCGARLTDGHLQVNQEESVTNAENPFKILGNVVTYGYYEQDLNFNNGPEKIEWYVIAVEGEKSLLLSKYGLDARKYNKFEDITWKDSEIRKWLNSDFYSIAFDDKEKSSILMVIVENGKRQGYSGWDTDGGSSTYDRVFLLSYYEVGEGHPMDVKIRQCAPTDYAIAASKKVWYMDSAPESDEGRKLWHWWLRSPGDRQRDAAIMGTDGSTVRDDVVDAPGCVRPAIWVRLD